MVLSFKKYNINPCPAMPGYTRGLDVLDQQKYHLMLRKLFFIDALLIQ